MPNCSWPLLAIKWAGLTGDGLFSGCPTGTGRPARTLIRLLFGSGEGVFAGFELDAHRRALQVHNPAEGFFQIAHVMTGYRCSLVAVNNNDRRVVSTRMGVTQLDSTAIDHGRLMI